MLVKATERKLRTKSEQMIVLFLLEILYIVMIMPKSFMDISLQLYEKIS